MAKIKYSDIKQLFVTGGNDLVKVDPKDSKVKGQQNFDAQSQLLGRSERIFTSIKQARRPIVVAGAYIAEDPAMASRYSKYLKKCVENSFMRGEAPYCGSLVNYKILKYNNPIEKDIGIMTDVSFVTVTGNLAVYIDYGITPAMFALINVAKVKNARIEYRKIGQI